MQLGQWRCSEPCNYSVNVWGDVVWAVQSTEQELRLYVEQAKHTLFHRMLRRVSAAVSQQFPEAGVALSKIERVHHTMFLPSRGGAAPQTPERRGGALYGVVPEVLRLGGGGGGGDGGGGTAAEEGELTPRIAAHQAARAGKSGGADGEEGELTPRIAAHQVARAGKSGDGHTASGGAVVDDVSSGVRLSDSGGGTGAPRRRRIEPLELGVGSPTQLLHGFDASTLLKPGALKALALRCVARATAGHTTASCIPSARAPCTVATLSLFHTTFALCRCCAAVPHGSGT